MYDFFAYDWRVIVSHKKEYVHEELHPDNRSGGGLEWQQSEKQEAESRNDDESTRPSLKKCPCQGRSNPPWPL